MLDDELLGVGPRGQVVAIWIVGMTLAAHGARELLTVGLEGAFWLVVGLSMITFVSLPGVKW